MYPSKIIKIILCTLACVIWITVGAYMIANPEKEKTMKSIFVMLSVVASLLAVLGGILL